MQRIETAATIVMEPEGAARAAVIWLHGLGADGEDFVPVAGELGLPRDHGIRFVFPHAPVRPVTLNGGLPMRAWYDILSLSREGLQDEAGIRASERLVNGLIAQQRAAGIASTRIVLAGFSQGGAVALHTGLRHAEPLGGLIALSTYLPLDSLLKNEMSPANRALPILMQHGRYDGVVPYTLGVLSRDLLVACGYAVQWQDYPMDHTLCLEQITDIGRWLQQRLA